MASGLAFKILLVVWLTVRSLMRSVYHGSSSPHCGSQEFNFDPAQKLWGKRKRWEEYDDIIVQKQEGRARWSKHVFQTRTTSELRSEVERPRRRCVLQRNTAVSFHWNLDSTTVNRDRNCSMAICSEIKEEKKRSEIRLMVSWVPIALTQALWGFYRRSAFALYCHLSPASDGWSRRLEKSAAHAELIVIFAVLLGP